MTELAMPSLSHPYPVAGEDVTAFRRDGHVLLRGVASASEAGAFRPVIRSATMRLSQETRRLEDRDTYSRAFLQVCNLWRKDEDVARFVLAARFAGAAAALLGVERLRPPEP